MRNNTTNVIETLESREMFSATLLTVGHPMVTSLHETTLNVSSAHGTKKVAPAHKKPAKIVKPAKPAKPSKNAKVSKKTAVITTTTTTTTTVVVTGWTIAAAAPVDAEPAVSVNGTTNANFSSHPLFASNGPTQDDIHQGQAGDCYYLATLAAIAKSDPARIEQSIVQESDGTYVVQIFKGSTPEYVHVDGSLPTWSNGAPVYAGLGQQGSTWVAIMEKAFAEVRTGANSYASLNSGWMTESFSTFNLTCTGIYNSSDATQLVNTIQSQLASNEAVTIGINTPAQGAALIGSHAYEVVSTDGTNVVLRNPWGIDGVDNSSNPSDGFVTVTAAQLFASQMGIVSAAA